jgi:hypothetical protein
MQEQEHYTTENEYVPESEADPPDLFFKCGQCGQIYPYEFQDSRECPNCGHLNKKGEALSFYPGGDNIW